MEPKKTRVQATQMPHNRSQVAGAEVSVPCMHALAEDSVACKQERAPLSTCRQVPEARSQMRAV